MIQNVETNLTAINETDKRGQEILRLITLYIPGFKGKYYGHRPIGVDDLAFPAVMVEPIRQTAMMVSTGKYELHFTYNIYFYVLNSNRESLLSIQTGYMESLIKLFSNNALNDLSTTFTQQFKTDPGFWITSEMRQMAFSASYAWSRADGTQYARAGLMMLEVVDKVIK